MYSSDLCCMSGFHTWTITHGTKAWLLHGVCRIHLYLAHVSKESYESAVFTGFRKMSVHAATGSFSQTGFSVCQLPPSLPPLQQSLCSPGALADLLICSCFPLFQLPFISSSKHKHMVLSASQTHKPHSLSKVTHILRTSYFNRNINFTVKMLLLLANTFFLSKAENVMRLN